MSEPSSSDEFSPAFKAAITASLNVINDLKLSPEEHLIAFRVGLDYHLGGGAPPSAALYRGVGSGNIDNTGSVNAGSNTSTSTPAPAGDLLDKIGARMKLDRDTLELIYAIQDGELDIVLSAKRLPDIKTAAAKALAQLVMGARQAAGLEEWTSVNTIRSVVQDFGKLDSNNFAAQMQQLDTVCVISGRGVDRKMKVTKGGMEEIAALVASLAGVTS